jgi:hypothetical protein
MSSHALDEQIISSLLFIQANASSLRFVVAPVEDKPNQAELVSHYNQALQSKYFGLESEGIVGLVFIYLFLI